MKMTDLQKLAAAVQQQQEQEQVLRKVAAIQKLAALEEIAQMSQALEELRKEAGAKELASNLLRRGRIAGKRTMRGAKKLPGRLKEAPGKAWAGIKAAPGAVKDSASKVLEGVKATPGRSATEGIGALLAGAGLIHQGMSKEEIADTLAAAQQYGLGTGVGALGGAGLGAAIADNPLEGGVYGALAGAPVGAGATYLARLAKEKGWV